MRTAQIVYEFPSISETFVLSQIRGLIQHGWDVRIFADSRGVNAELTGATSDLSDRTRYFGLPFKAAREALGQRKMRTPPASHAIAFTPQRPRPNGVRLNFEARAFAGQGKFDVVHAHFGPNGVRAVRLRAKGVLSSPVVTSFYGYDITRQWARGGYGELLSHGDCFIALSETMRRQLVALGAPPDRVTVHRLGVDLKRFKRAQGSTGRLEIISIARLVEKKGLEHGIRAVAQLAKRNIPFRYRIVGDGELYWNLRDLASELQILDHVEFIGAASQERIANLLSRSDMLLAPSITAIDGDTEGTPVAILEALASGIPVVSTMHSAIPEVVQDGVSGFLVAERDDAALANRIAHLADDGALRMQMGEAGRAFVEENHDIAKLNQELARIYERVLEP